VIIVKVFIQSKLGFFDVLNVKKKFVMIACMVGQLAKNVPEAKIGTMAIATIAATNQLDPLIFNNNTTIIMINEYTNFLTLSNMIYIQYESMSLFNITDSNLWHLITNHYRDGLKTNDIIFYTIIKK
jgi:hypothetical protein